MRVQSPWICHVNLWEFDVLVFPAENGGAILWPWMSSPFFHKSIRSGSSTATKCWPLVGLLLLWFSQIIILYMLKFGLQYSNFSWSFAKKEKKKFYQLFRRICPSNFNIGHRACKRWHHSGWKLVKMSHFFKTLYLQMSHFQPILTYWKWDIFWDFLNNVKVP